MWTGKTAVCLLGLFPLMSNRGVDNPRLLETVCGQVVPSLQRNEKRKHRPDNDFFSQSEMFSAVKDESLSYGFLKKLLLMGNRFAMLC